MILILIKKKQVNLQIYLRKIKLHTKKIIDLVNEYTKNAIINATCRYFLVFKNKELTVLLETYELHTFKRWVGSAPWAKSSSTTARWPPAQARDNTVWSLLAVVLFTFAPETDKGQKIILLECGFLYYGKLQNHKVKRTV